MILLLSLGALIILVLAAVAAYYLWRLRALKKANQQKLQALEEQSEQQRLRVNRSIQVIARAVGKDELSLTEASIRISVLLDSLGLSHEQRDNYSAFYQLRDATAHIPILENWKRLSKKEQRRYDIQRLEQENIYREFVLDAAQRIQEKMF